MFEFDQHKQSKKAKSIRFPPGLWDEVQSFAKAHGVDESAAVRALVRTALHLPQEKAPKARGSKS